MLTFAVDPILRQILTHLRETWVRSAHLSRDHRWDWQLLASPLALGRKIEL